MASVTQQHVKGQRGVSDALRGGSAPGAAPGARGMPGIGMGMPGWAAGLAGSAGCAAGLAGSAPRNIARVTDAWTIGLQHCSASRARGSLQCIVQAGHALQCKQGMRQPAVHCASGAREAHPAACGAGSCSLHGRPRPCLHARRMHSELHTERHSHHCTGRHTGQYMWQLKQGHTATQAHLRRGRPAGQPPAPWRRPACQRMLVRCCPPATMRTHRQ
jgi:hypothetical protein